MGTLRGAMFIVGGAIGAGFITGAELVRFFGAEYFLVSVIFSSALFCLLSMLFLFLGRKYKGFDGVLALFGRGGIVIRALFYGCLIISAAGMLAGLDALLPKVSPLLSCIGLALAVLFTERGTDGISKLNLILVPILLVFVFCLAAGKLSFGYPTCGKGAGGALYAGMNILFLAPVLMDAGEKMKHPVLSSILAASLICLVAALILARIAHEGEGALHATMPFLYATGGRLFPAAVALAIFTSLVSSLYPPMAACGHLSGKRQIAAKGGVLLAAFALSRFGLSGIVSMFYPIIGGLGLLFSAFCILYDQLFKKHHKEVHSRGEKT